MAQHPQHLDGEIFAEARDIAAKLPKKIDPDTLAVRKILADFVLSTSNDGKLILAGGMDENPAFLHALSTYRQIKSGDVA